MSQNFNKLLGSSIIKNDRATINENFDAIRSAHSGTAFPMQELIAGMEFFNTSTKKLYRLQPDLSTWTLELDLSSGTAVIAKASSADTADTAGKASKDANGKDISTYVAKLESDVNNAFVINFYDGNNNKLGAVTIPETKIEVMTGASSDSAGEAGLVPAPSAGAKNRYLNAYGDFDEIDVPVKSVNGETGDVQVGKIVDASISGRVITLTFADGTSKTLTTQDTVGSTVSITAGTISSNGTIPLPSGYTRAQCKYAAWIHSTAGTKSELININQGTGKVTTYYTNVGGDNLGASSATIGYLCVAVK